MRRNTEEIAGYAPLMLKTIKRFVTQSILPKGPAELMGIAVRDLEIVNNSEDFKEGMAASRERWLPVYVGR